MTSDSLKRNPLSEKQYQINGDAGVVCRGLKFDDVHCSSFENPLKREFPLNSTDVQKDHCTADSAYSLANSATCLIQSTSPPRSIFLPLNQTNSNMSNIYGGGFRYHVRRPVESWKFFETNKSDGSKVYLCRLCGSSYKHKKSLNKHWKDKHFTELSNAEGNCQADGELDEGDDGDGEDSEGDGKPLNNSYNTPLSSFENANLNKLNNKYLEGRENYSYKSPDSVGRTYSMRTENSENCPPDPNHLMSRTMGSGQNGNDLKNDIVVSRSNIITEIHKSVPGDHSDRFVVGRKRLSSVPYSSPVVQPKVHSRVSEYGVKRVRSPNTDYTNLGSKRRHSVISRGREECVVDVRDKISESSCCSNRNTPDGEIISSCATSRLGVNPVDRHVSEITLDEVEPLDLSVVRVIETEVDCGRPLSGTSVSPSSTVDLVKADAFNVNDSVKVQQEDLVSVTPTSISVDNGGKKQKRENRVSRALLIGLLQTALSTLENEVDDKMSESYELSATSASLLLAVGSLLVTLCEKKSSVCSVAAPVETCISKKSVDGATEGRSHSGFDGTVLLTTGSEKLVSNSRDCFQMSSETFPRLVADHSHSPDGCTSRPLETRKFVGEVEDSCVDRIVESRKDRGSLSTHEYGGINENEISFETLDNGPPLTGVEGMKKCDGSEPVIICPVCKFGARWFSELRAHMVNHSEHRMFGCCYCHYRAKWKWDVAKHMRRCPLGRHVSHLQNEALLRIVRYYPPPEDDILYSYFPQNGFPGVGVDHPPTPPINSVKRNGYERVRVYDCESKDRSLFSSRLCDESEVEGMVRGLVCEKKVESGNSGTSTSVSSANSVHQCYTLEGDVVKDVGDCEENESGGLVIVDDSEEVEKISEISGDAASTNGAKERICSTSDQCSRQNEDEDTNKSDLICRVRKCPLCEFHSTDTIEFQTHWNSHCPYTNETANLTRS
ncbi:hypothetical protein Smp_135890 [Schistosoma mansoni]|uniref:hypothetical protein n=1 Tax=Schistosoma mansoni TaxID=6183 RepID=UPI0001A63BB1|nr:hypothetical protein Smp_135890 [Schistosoma mansoni]|eukprot:XP_018654967.1 hypothetical protein Smp_135890 [Schistosoma mansoni]